MLPWNYLGNYLILSVDNICLKQICRKHVICQKRKEKEKREKGEEREKTKRTEKEEEEKEKKRGEEGKALILFYYLLFPRFAGSF